jgi:hypothetical protein
LNFQEEGKEPSIRNRVPVMSFINYNTNFTTNYLQKNNNNISSQEAIKIECLIIISGRSYGGDGC